MTPATILRSLGSATSRSISEAMISTSNLVRFFERAYE